MLQLVPPPQGWNLRKLENQLDPAVKAMALILSILLSKLKTHVARKREIYSKQIKRRRMVSSVLKIDTGFRERKKKVKDLKIKRKTVVGCGDTHL